MKPNNQTSATFVALVFTLTALLTIVVASAALPSRVNTDKLGVAVGGYDTVAFHTIADAVKGKNTIFAKHNGAVYRFASEANRMVFEKDPERFLPAYGGYCAWGISAKGKLFDVDIDTWEVIDGRLFLNYNEKIKKKFNEDRASHIRTADARWVEVMASTK